MHECLSMDMYCNKINTSESIKASLLVHISCECVMHGSHGELPHGSIGVRINKSSKK